MRIRWKRWEEKQKWKETKGEEKKRKAKQERVTKIRLERKKKKKEVKTTIEAKIIKGEKKQIEKQRKGCELVGIAWFAERMWRVMTKSTKEVEIKLS